jgi:endogenous inhibitor of DNA gyrase (YacG/DUF329 family)
MIGVIRVSCPDCGDRDIAPTQISARVVEAIDINATRRTFTFKCPGCAAEVTVPADRDVVLKLAAVGVVVEHVRVPPEAREAKTGAPFSQDDLIDFHCWLAELDTFPPELEQ